MASGANPQLRQRPLGRSWEIWPDALHILSTLLLITSLSSSPSASLRHCRAEHHATALLLVAVVLAG